MKNLRQLREALEIGTNEIVDAYKKATPGEAYEEKEPASPDESSMAMRQLNFMAEAIEEIIDHLEEDGDFPEWMQNKLTEAHTKIKDLYSSLDFSDEDEEDEDDMEESVNEAKKYTPPTKAEIEADKKKDQKGKPRPSMSAKSVNKNVYKNMMEKLTVADGMAKWIEDFQKSDAPQFKGKDSDERKQMAIAAYLGAKRDAKKSANESTKAYDKSERDRLDREKNARISPKDKVTLGKLAAMMAKEKGKK